MKKINKNKPTITVGAKVVFELPTRKCYGIVRDRKIGGDATVEVFRTVDVTTNQDVDDNRYFRPVAEKNLQIWVG